MKDEYGNSTFKWFKVDHKKVTSVKFVKKPPSETVSVYSLEIGIDVGGKRLLISRLFSSKEDRDESFNHLNKRDALDAIESINVMYPNENINPETKPDESND